ncbi:penicillin-binding protein, 1A family [compost metagenome]
MAGKTGTTNEAMDGWFAGYAGGVVTVAWMGYDDNRSLGEHEFGATTALPVWAAYMEGRLAGVPEAQPDAPAGLVRAGNDWIYAEYADGSHGIATLGFPQPPADALVAPTADPLVAPVASNAANPTGPATSSAPPAAGTQLPGTATGMPAPAAVAAPAVSVSRDGL